MLSRKKTIARRDAVTFEDIFTGCEISMGLLKAEARKFRIDRCNSFFPLHEKKKLAAMKLHSQNLGQILGRD